MMQSDDRSIPNIAERLFYSRISTVYSARLYTYMGSIIQGLREVVLFAHVNSDIEGSKTMNLSWAENGSDYMAF